VQSAPSEPAICARGLAKSFGPLPVLRRIDIEVARGECVAILGANGVGKSTLLRLFSGVSRPGRGELRLLGQECWPGRPRPELLARIGFVGHEPLVYRDLTPRQNLEFFARLYRLAKPDATQRVEMLLARLGLERVSERATRTLSRGTLQRLAIARAILPEPDLLLLDEPLTGLDAAARERVAEWLHEVHGRGTTIALVTHDLLEATAVATRAIVLDAGCVARDISPLPSPEELERLYLGSSSELSHVGHRP
jgi:ABC-type multidrug transport system ATPase subunit